MQLEASPFLGRVAMHWARLWWDKLLESKSTTHGGILLFIGHTRFSLFEPDSGAWHASKGTRFTTVDEYREHLFSDERLAPRAEAFIHESLPQLEVASKGHDLYHVVSYSDAIPERYEEALKEAAKRFPFVVLDRRVNGRASTSPDKVAIDAVSSLQPAGRVFGRYRLDDDDLLPATYFDQVASYVTSEHVGWMVSLGSGYTGIKIGDGYYDLRRAYFPMLALGLLSICKVDDSGKIIGPKGTPHHLSDRANPVIMDSRSIGYFWGRHPLQDTAVGRGVMTEAQSINRLRDTISQYPPVSEEEDIQMLFPAVAHKLHRQSGPASSAENMLSAPLILDHEGTPFEFPAKRNGIAMTIDIECAGSPKRHNALISFHLTDDAGNPVPKDLDALLADGGIVRSLNATIGHYRYLPTVEGERTMDYLFDLPEGVECRGVSVRRFGESASQIRLTRLSISEI